MPNQLLLQAGRAWTQLRARISQRAFWFGVFMLVLAVVLIGLTAYLQADGTDTKPDERPSALGLAVGIGVVGFFVGILGNVLAQRYLDWEKKLASAVHRHLRGDDESQALGQALGACLRLAADRLQPSDAADAGQLVRLAVAAEEQWLTLTARLPESSALWVPKLSLDQARQLLNPAGEPVVSRDAALQLLRIANGGTTPKFAAPGTPTLVSETVLRDFNRALLVALRLSDAGGGGIALGFQERAVQELAREVQQLRQAVARDGPAAPQSQQPAKASPAPAAVSVATPLSPQDADWLSRTYQREVESMTREWSFVFSRYRYQSRLKSISEDPVMAELYAGWSKGFLHHQNELSSQMRTGLGDINSAVALINRQGGLRLVLSPAHAASLALFAHLKEAEGLNVTVDFKRSHSVEILRQVKRGDLQADGFTLTIATAGGFLVHQQAASHLPFMLMPGMTHGVLAPKQDAISSLPLDGEYYLMKETAGTELLVLRDLVRSHPGASVGLIDAEPDVATEALAAGGRNVRSIIGFPHYEFNVRFNDCLLLPFSAEVSTPTKPIVFFLSAEKAANRGYADALQLLVRDSWHKFTQSAETRQRAVSLLLGNPDYVDVLFRITGLSARRQVFVGAPAPAPATEGGRQRPPGALECRHAALDELISLRHAVLRPQGATEDAVLPGDHDLQTRHYGAFNAHGRAVACVSLMASAWADQPAWQLRAMAVAEPLRGTGVGSSLLSYALRDLALLDRTRPIWCNARLSAQGFYERHGWQAVSDPFDNGAAGRSVRMLRAAPPTSGVSNVYSGALS